MRRYYVMLENNIVIRVIDTPQVYSGDNYVEISSFDTNLIGATYNSQTQEFTKTA